MGKTRKKPKRRMKSRQPPQKQSKSSLSSLKWILIFSAIAVVSILSIWGAKSLFHRFLSSPQAKPSSSEGRPVEDSAVPSKLTAERETAVLKKAETELIETVMKDFPNNENALKLIGDFHSRHGKRTEAVKFWQQCLDINPRRADVYGNMGDAAMDKGEFERAIEQFSKAIEIDPKAYDMVEKKGQALVELGRYGQAIKVLEETRLVSPKSVMAHFLLGQAYLKKKQYEKARDYYLMATEIDPEYENAYYGLTRVYAALKQQAKAKEYLQKFRKLENIMAKKDRARSTGASLYTRDFASLRNAVAQTHLDAEQLYLAKRNIGKAEELLKKAIELDPKNTTCYERLGALYNMTNRLDEAIRQFQRISEIEPSNIYPYLNIGRISIMLKKYDAAEAAYGKVITVAPQQAVGYRELSRSHLISNRKLIEARKLAEKALSLEPSAESFFLLGWAYDLNGDRSGALKAIQEAKRLEPNNSKYRQIYERIKSAK